MASQQQSRAQGVSLHSHLQGVVTLAYFALYSVRPNLARAARAELTARDAALAESPAAGRSTAALSRPAGYARLLGAAYALTPVLVVAAWRALAQAFPGAAVASVGACLLLLLPALVHVAHGATRRAGLALASLVGYLAFGSGVGALLGRAVANASCDPETQGECGLTVLGGLLVGAVAGGVLGYCVHAVRQVLLAAQPNRRHAVQ